MIMASKNKSSPRIWDRSHTIQDEFVQKYRCDNCFTPLNDVTFKGVLLCYSTNQSFYNGFICWKCAIQKSKTCKRISITYQDLDNYLWSKMFPKVPIEKRW